MFKLNLLSYKNYSDEKLLLAIQNGDSKAFNELYIRYNDRILYFFYRMLGNNKETAQDFLQDLFFKIIDKPHLYDSNKKFSTWIFSIAHNMCKNEYRSRSIRKILENTENTDCFAEEVETEFSSRIHIDDIFKCLNNFDEEQSTAFLLKYKEGLSIDEISKVLNIPKGTVKSRLFYVRKKIQEKLAKRIE